MAALIFSAARGARAMRGWMLAALLTAAGAGLVLLGSTEARRWLRPVGVGIGLLAPRHETASYRARIEAFARENEQLSERCAVLLGDSLSEGFPVTDAARLGLVNRGISGDRVVDLARRLEVSVLETSCQDVLLLGGTNDVVLDGAKPARVAASLLAIAERAATTGRQVFLVSLPPTAGRHAAAHPRVRALNRHLEDAARKHGLGWLDLHAALAAPDDGAAKGLDSDGLHLNEEGYARFAALVGEVESGSDSFR